MKLKWALPSLVLALLPASAAAQPAGHPAEVVTGVESEPPERLAEMGLDPVPPERIEEYLHAVEALDTSIQVETRGETRERFGVDRVDIEAEWERRPGRSTPVLKSLSLVPGEPDWLRNLRDVPPGNRARTVWLPTVGNVRVEEIEHEDDGTIELEVSGWNYEVHPDGEVTKGPFDTIAERPRIGGRINRVDINARGEMELDIDDAPDVTVDRVTRRPDGGLRLHVGGVIGWLDDINVDPEGNVDFFGDRGSMEFLTEIDQWPPEVQAVVDAFQGDESDEGETTTDAVVRYRIRGESGDYDFPFMGGLPADSDFDVRGAVEVRPDGTLRTIGDDDTIEVELRVGERDFEVDQDGTRVETARAEGGATFEGGYRLHVPAGDRGDLELTVEGDLDYDVTGRRVVVDMPSGTRVSSGQASLNGRANVSTSLGVAGGRMVVEDGRYVLDLRGPIGIEGLETERLTAEDLDFTGALRSEGTIVNEGDGLAARGDLRGDLRVDGNDGLVTVLNGERGEARARLEDGSRLRLDLGEGTVATEGNVGPERHAFGGAAGRGTLDFDGHFRGVEVRGGTRADAERVAVDVDAEVDASTADGLRSASGSATARLESDADVEVSGLPGGPTVDGRAAREPRREASEPARHTVAPGDTLWAISREHDTTVAALKETNGLSSDVIDVGDVLRIPGSGSEPAPARSETAGDLEDGTVRSTIEEGTEVRFDVDSARFTEEGLEVDGRVTTDLTLHSSELRVGSVRGELLGVAAASLQEARFSVRPGRERPLHVGRVEIPARVELDPGSTVHIAHEDLPSTIQIDRPGSYAEFRAVVVSDERGLRLLEVRKIDLHLQSNGAARFAGDVAEVPGDKTITYEGRMELREGGIDFFGDVAVRVHGEEDEPIVRIDW